MTRPAHILLGDRRGRARRGAPGRGSPASSRPTVGAHEVITTIMLNWIAYWIGNYLFQQGGPLQGAANKPLDIPISGDVAKSAKLPVFWGDPELQGLHIGFFVAIAALVVFWVILNRTTLGYEVRAVGYNPDAAAYGGIKVAHELRARDGDLRRLRGARRRPRHARLPLPLRDVGRPGLDHRLPRDRGRAARPEHRARSRARRAPLRRAPLRDDARPPVERDRPEPRRPPDRDDPGPGRPVRRRGRADHRGLARGRAAAQAAAEAAPRRRRPREHLRGTARRGALRAAEGGRRGTDSRSGWSRSWLRSRRSRPGRRSGPRSSGSSRRSRACSPRAAAPGARAGARSSSGSSGSASACSPPARARRT